MADDNVMVGPSTQDNGGTSETAKPEKRTMGPDANVLTQGKTAVGDVDDTNDPKALHTKFQTALQNSRDKYKETLNAKAPKKRHTALGLTNMILGLAGTALDPSHQLGVNYVAGVRRGQEARDQDYNQRAAGKFQRQQQQGLADSQNFNEDAARYLTEEQAAQGRKDAIDKQTKDDADAKDASDKATHDKLIGDIRADIPGYLKMLDPNNDDIVRHLGARMLKNHIASYGQYYGEAGYPNAQNDLNQVADNVLNSKKIKTPKQIAEEAKAREATANATKAEADAKAEPQKIKDTADEIHARTGASKLQSKKLAQDLSWAPKDHAVKIAQAHATLAKTYKEIDEVSARTKKLREKNGSTVYGNLTPDQVKSLTKTNTMLGQTMREQEAAIKGADKWISDNTFGGKLLDPTEANELTRQRKIKASSQKYYNQLTKKAHALRQKLGVPSPDSEDE